MQTIWLKRYARILSNFGISFLTPFSGSGVGQSLYRGNVDLGEMFFVALLSSSIYTLLVTFQEVRQFGNKT